MKRLFAAAVMTALLMAAPAAAQQYPPAVNSITVGCRTPAPGEVVDVQARTFAAGAEVTVSLGETAIGSAAADGSGIASVKATIPADAARGDYDLTASGQAPDGSTLTLSTKITVADGCGAAAAPAAPAGSLPRTGDDSSIPLVRLGLALAALGGVITALAAKRRKAAHAAAA
ncbi:MAG TPA: LPXTG cell wall anchor domain-containing protein [Acidimicrobiales bacterium]